MTKVLDSSNSLESEKTVEVSDSSEALDTCSSKIYITSVLSDTTEVLNSSETSDVLNSSKTSQSYISVISDSAQVLDSAKAAKVLDSS